MFNIGIDGVAGPAEQRSATGQPLKLAELIELYRKSRLRNGSYSAQYQYRLNLKRLTKRLHREPLITDLTEDTIADAMDWLVRYCRLAPSSANKMRDNFHALMRFAIARGLTDMRLPETQELVEPVRIPTAWTMDELRRLFKACREQRGMIGGVAARDWWTALHSVMWDTGERISALMAVEWSDVDMGRGFITVRAEGRKGKRSDHLSKLHPDTISTLQMIRNPPRPKVFPWPFHPLYLWVRYKKFREAAGLPIDRMHSFHCMRKSSASWLEAAGGNAQLMLGHSTRNMTLTYLDPRIVSARGPCDVLPRIG